MTADAGGQPAEGATLARRAAAALGPELDDLRDTLEALELIAVLLEGADAEAIRRLTRHRKRPVGPGVGAKMLATLAAQEWMYRGGPCDACADLALEALAGGELIAADNGLLGVSAINVLALADRCEVVEAWEHSLADAHRRGSLFSRKSVTLWRGFTLYRRGELVDAEESVRSSAEGKLWGMGLKGRLYHDAVLCTVLRERGEREVPLAIRSAAPAQRGLHGSGSRKVGRSDLDDSQGRVSRRDPVVVIVLCYHRGVRAQRRSPRSRRRSAGWRFAMKTTRGQGPFEWPPAVCS